MFLALGVAFAIAVPIAQHYGVSISAEDMAVAGRIAEFWWVPAAIAVASFLAAAVVAVEDRSSPRPGTPRMIKTSRGHRPEIESPARQRRTVIAARATQAR